MKAIIVFYLFFVLCSGEENPFEKLGDLNEKWLRATSFPEAAFILKHSPYSYHSGVLANLRHSAVGYDNLSLAVDATSCSDDILQILTHFDSDWALQMLDSNGKLDSGLLRGGLIWPGHFGECIDVHSPTDGSGHGGFGGQYCVTSWTVNASQKYSNLPLSVGLCVPDSCSEDYLKAFGDNALQVLELLPYLKDHSSLLTLNKVTCKLKEKKMDASSITYLCFISIFLSLSVIGTLVTYLKKRKNSLEIYQKSMLEAMIKPSAEDSVTIDVDSKKCSRTLSETGSHTSDKLALTTTPELNSPPNQEFTEKPAAFMRQFWQCFSLIENGEKILNTKTNGDQLLSIHGIRFLSLTWVILGHTYVTPITIIGNRIDVLKEMDSFLFQVLLQSPFSVDSFFLLSGFLLAYLFLKEADKKNGRISWIYFYAHRIWRLTPAYMVVVFFYILVFKYLGSGPFWDDHHCDAARGSWWKYLLYINNFIPINDMCVGWSWYLANDMQFYIISPLFLYPLWRWPVIGFSILISFLIGTWTTTAILSYHFDLIPMFVGASRAATDFTAYSKRMWDSFDLIYDKPYCRIAPYIIGVALGFALYKLNKRKKFLNWWQQIVGWCVAGFCGLSVIFGLYHVEMSRTTSLFYNSLCRSSFSISLAWLIFVCETGHGGPISKLLSWKFWIPLSRLTYAAYLIHPIFIHAYYQSYQSALFFTEYLAVTNFLGFLVMSYVAALAFSAVFESPLMNLEKLLLSRRKEK